MSFSHKNTFIILICFLSFLLGITINIIFPLHVFEQKTQSFIEQKFWKEKINSGTLSKISQEKSPINLDLFYEAYKQASDNYYWFDSLSEKDLVSGMIKWFIGAFWDKHSEYFNMDETKKFNEVLSWDF